MTYFDKCGRACIYTSGGVMIKKAIILCGGWGTRFLPITKSISKELLPLFDTPILQYIVDDLIQNGVTDIAFVLRPDKTDITKHFTKNLAYESVANAKQTKILQNYKAANFHFIFQNTARGTGDALMSAKSFVNNDNFLVLNGDEVVVGRKSLVSQMLAKHNEFCAPVIAVKAVKTADISKYGMVKLDLIVPHRVLGIVEKPSPARAPSKLSSLGAFVLEPSIFNYIVECDQMPLTDAIELYAKTNYLYCAKITGERYDLGTPLGFVISNLSFALHRHDTRAQTISALKKLGFVER